MANPLDCGRPLRAVWGLFARVFFRPDGNSLCDLASAGVGGFRDGVRHMPKILWEPIPTGPDDSSSHPLVQRALATRGLLRQTDDVTCGAASLIVARMLIDEPYARMILTGHDDRTGRTDPAGTDVEAVRARFAEQSDHVHARSSRGLGAGPSPRARGLFRRMRIHVRLPWPRALGTAPWAVRDELSRFRRQRFRVALVDSDSPESRHSAYAALANAAAAGIHCALFTGNGFLPRHVVLVLGTDESATELTVYDPGRGVVVGLTPSEFLSDLGAVSWSRPWAVVLPSG